MTRLTNDTRDRILNDLIRHRFQPEMDAINAATKVLANAVYETVYDAETRQKMDALPEGWLFEDDDLEVTFAGRRVRIGLNGSMWHNEPLNILARGSDQVFRRFLNKHRSNSIAHFGADHPHSLAFEKITQDRDRLKEAVSISKRQTSAALNAVSTVEALIKAWPEVKPFAERWIEEKDSRPKLPAIPVESLNAVLGLPADGGNT